jgi:hypothetical protein
MAKFCEDDCSAICDFCKNYQDEYRDINKTIREDGELEFAGNGICSVDNAEVDACDGDNCDNFICFMSNS